MSQPVVSAIEHYESLLANHYTWMSGGFDAKVAAQAALFKRLHVHPAATRKAVDLGCGPGFQSLALAQMGFAVTSIDANRQMLDELNVHARNLEIRTVLHDLSTLRTCSSLPAQADCAVCMGDTLIHLPTLETVTELFAQVHDVLAPGGLLILGFRDLSQELFGLDRFIPVRSDDDRVMTCILEYEADRVIVTDLIYQREDDGWKLLKSSYRKLRPSVDWVRNRLERQGFTVCSQETTAGVCNLVAQKP